MAGPALNHLLLNFCIYFNIYIKLFIKYLKMHWIISGKVARTSLSGQICITEMHECSDSFSADKASLKSSLKY